MFPKVVVPQNLQIHHTLRFRDETAKRSAYFFGARLGTKKRSAHIRTRVFVGVRTWGLFPYCSCGFLQPPMASWTSQGLKLRKFWDQVMTFSRRRTIQKASEGLISMIPETVLEWEKKLWPNTCSKKSLLGKTCVSFVHSYFLGGKISRFDLRICFR